MKREFFLFLFIFLLLISTSGCMDEGCFYDGTNIYITDYPKYRISTDAESIENITNAKFEISVLHNNIKEVKWKLKYKEINDNPKEIIFSKEKVSPTQGRPYYKYTNNEWVPFSIIINIDSNNQYLSNLTLFNESNIITGQLKTDGATFGRHIEVTFDKEYPGVEFSPDNSISEIRISTSKFSLIFSLRNIIGCA